MIEGHDLAAKNSRKRRAAPSPASATSAGTTARAAVTPTVRDPETVVSSFIRFV